MGAKELAATMGNGSRIGPDVAAAMSFGGAGREATEIVFQRYVNDRADIDKLFYKIYDRTIEMAIRIGWRPHQGKDRKGIIAKIVLFAIAEEVRPNRCITCFGRQSVVIDNKVHVCPACNGVGRRVIQDKERAELFGITPRQFRRWKGIYGDIRGIVGSFESEGVRAIARGFWERT